MTDKRTDGQSGRQTDRHMMTTYTAPGASVASRGKNTGVEERLRYKVKSRVH